MLHILLSLCSARQAAHIESNLYIKNELIYAVNNATLAHSFSTLGKSITLNITVPHTIIFPRSTKGTMTVDFMDNNMKVISKNYSWNSLDKLPVFIDSEKFTMNVKLSDSSNGEVTLLVNPIQTQKCYIGTSKEINIDLMKGETAQLFITDLNSTNDEDPNYSVFLNDTSLDDIQIEDQSDEGMRKSMAENESKKAIIANVRVSNGKENGSIRISSTSSKEQLITYKPSNSPVKAEIGSKDNEYEDDKNLVEDTNVKARFGTGAIVGIVFRCICVLAIIAAVVVSVVKRVLCFKKKSSSDGANP